MPRTLTPELRERALDAYRRAEAAARDSTISSAAVDTAARELLLINRQIRAAEWEPYPWQHPHTHPPDWTGPCTDDCYTLPDVLIPTHGAWLLMGGRGTGKSDGAARYVAAHVAGHPCDTRIPGGHKMLMVAPTQGDAVEVIQGPSGLEAVSPGAQLFGGAGGLAVRFRSGARMRVLGAYTPDDENRLRAAGNNCLVYLEEAAAMRHLTTALTHTGLGLRIGDHAHYVIATTPKARPEIRALQEDPATVRTWGTTDRAIHLDAAVRESLERKHGGTRLGRQELGGETLQDVEGALWVHEQDYQDPADARPGIQNDRLPAGSVVAPGHPDPGPDVQVVHRCVVAVDPNQGGADEAGIGVLGSIGDHAYILADLSARLTSDQWARRAVQAYFDYAAEGIVLEKSGGDNPTLIIRSVELDDGRRGSSVPIFYAPTKVGKRLRAEPVAAVYEQHRVHHVGLFPELEDQQTGWVPDESKDSPDRVDWLVHGVTHLLIRSAPGAIASPASGQGRGPNVRAVPGIGAARGGIPPGRSGATRPIR